MTGAPKERVGMSQREAEMDSQLFPPLIPRYVRLPAFLISPDCCLRHAGVQLCGHLLRVSKLLQSKIQPAVKDLVTIKRA